MSATIPKEIALLLLQRLFQVEETISSSFSWTFIHYNFGWYNLGSFSKDPARNTCQRDKNNYPI